MGIVASIIVGLFCLFCGLRSVITKEFDDKKDKYTEESKEKAAIVLGIVFILLAILQGIRVFCQLQGIALFNNDMTSLLILIGAVLVVVIITLIIIYTVILKKKEK